MAFTVLYLEDLDDDYRVVKSAVTTHNKEHKDDPIVLIRVETVAELHTHLTVRCDVLIADLIVPLNSGEPADDDRIADILSAVDDFCARDTGVVRFPVIAYTRRNDAAVTALATYKDRLFDIWDKSLATPAYVLWRLVRLSGELSRQRPDAFSQKLIREMPSGATWHESVVEMARDYGSGITERDQVERATHGIYAIARSQHILDQVRPLWESMKSWEPISRAVSDSARGHARHVINVFWMGYYLLQQGELQGWATSRWREIVAFRAGADSRVAAESASLMLTWYLSALFHDVGGVVEA